RARSRPAGCAASFAAAAGDRRRERRALLREDHREQLGGLGLAHVARFLVGHPWWFEKHVAHLVVLPGTLARDLRHHLALEDVGEDEAGMPMRHADASGRIVDMA